MTNGATTAARSRRCQNGTTRNALSSGTPTTRFLFPKFFPKKIWPKNWGGSSNGGFRERHVCGSGPAPPRPPFVQMKNTRGVFFPPVFRPRSGGARQQFPLLGAEISLQKFCPYLQPHPSSRRLAWRRLAPSAADQRFFIGGRPGLRRQGKGDHPIVCQSWWRPRCRSAQRPPAPRLRPGVAALPGAGEASSCGDGRT